MSKETNLPRRTSGKKHLVIPQTIVTSPSNGLPRVEDSFRHDDGARLEEQLQLQHLEQLRYWFENHRSVPRVTDDAEPCPAYQRRGRLSRDDFKQVIAMVIGSHDYDHQLDSLFTKLDSTCDGYVDWDEFVSYILLQLREGDYGEAKRMVPFNSEPRIRHLVYNRQETTSKIVALDNPTKYVTVSKEGVICVWDAHLHLERHSAMTCGEPGTTSSRRLVREWVTDAVHMPNTRKVVIASTGRDLRFYDVTSGHYVEENHLYALPHVPTCLCYWFDTKSRGGESILLYGDDHGAINLLYFLEPLTQLFNAPFNKRRHGPQRIYSHELPQHGRWVRHVRVEDVHPAEPVRKLLYMAHCDRVMSSSACPRNSLSITHVERKKKTYVFKSNKGVECFDYSQPLNIIVTGSLDHIVRVWNPFVTSKPTGVLIGHSMGVVDVVIHHTAGHIFSCSKDATLKVWDTKDYSCLQTIFLKFPTNLAGRLPEYGPFAMHLQPPPTNTLLLAANDYIALLRVGPVAPPATEGTVSHLAQLYGALYNSYYKQVVTGADDSMLAVWDIETGVKCLVFANAHDTEEITAMAFDDSRRRLVTGARDGSIKVWNIQNGQSLQTLQRVSDAEVTGIVQLADRKLILAVGWSRLITVYDDSDPDCATVKADTTWKGGQVHRDDIIAVAHCPAAMLLATASFDGEICVWSTETQLLIVRLRKPCKCSKFKLPLDLSALISGFTPPTTPGSRPTSRPTSRPNSRHRRSYKNPPGQPIPVDKLLFLEARERGKKGEAATLVSSEAGCLHWWNLWMSPHEMGHCYLPDEPDEAVLALATDSTNGILVSGDTHGRVAVWDIRNYCTSVQHHRVTTTPEQISSWSAHDSTVVSVEYVVHDSGVYVLTASTDKKAKLFTIGGQCVGTFGQKLSWNLKNLKTWHDQPEVSEKPHRPEDELRGTPSELQQISDDELDSPREQLQQQESHVNGDVIEGDTQDDDSSSDNDGDDGDNEDDDEEIINSTSIRKVRKPISVGPCSLGRSNGLHSSGRDVFVRSHTFAYGSDTPLASRLLGHRVEKCLEKRTLDRQGRRELLADVDFKQVTRTGKHCCPYKLLATKELSDVFLPTNMPVTARMVSRGYTSADLTMSMVSNMDMTSLYAEDPLQTKDASTRAKKLWDVAMHKLPAIARTRSVAGSFSAARSTHVAPAQKRRVSAMSAVRL